MSEAGDTTLGIGPAASPRSTAGKPNEEPEPPDRSTTGACCPSTPGCSRRTDREATDSATVGRADDRAEPDDGSRWPSIPLDRAADVIRSTGCALEEDLIPVSVLKPRRGSSSEARRVSGVATEAASAPLCGSGPLNIPAGSAPAERGGAPFGGSAASFRPVGLRRGLSPATRGSRDLSVVSAARRTDSDCLFAPRTLAPDWPPSAAARSPIGWA